MKTLTTLIMGLILLSAMATTTPNSSATIQQMNRIPLSFTKNMGQWDERVLYRANAGGATMWFTKEGVTYQFTRHVDRDTNVFSRHSRVAGLAGMPIPQGDKYENDSVEQLVLTAKFVGANPNPVVIAEGQMEYKCNYFIGNEPMKWRTDVPNYEAITLKDIYPGIDLKYSGDNNGQAAYEFIAAPGADIAQIKVAYEGAEKTSIDADGRLVLKTQWGDMVGGNTVSANGVLSGTASFSQLSEKTIGFEADRSTKLTTGGASQQAVDTLLVVYSTYLGGGGYDRGFGIAVDDSGFAYVIGFTESSDFPTFNPYQTDQGDRDVFVTKFSADGNSLIYSTYLGGGAGESGIGIAIDARGNAYLMGSTRSSDFPTKNSYQQTFGGGVDDNFVTKLASSGDSLIYSTYLGGGNSDQGMSIAVDVDGSAYVTGRTNSSNFPTQNPYQATNQGGYDAFVTKLDSTGNDLIYSSYLGGGGDEWGFGITVDDSSNAYLTGLSYSSDFPTQNPVETYQGAGDAFVTKFSNSGNSLIYSTYLGGGDYDQGYGIAVDTFGNAYVTGWTQSNNFPLENPFQWSNAGSEDAFVTKFSADGNSLIYSTYLGGSAGDRAYGLAVDYSGCAYVMGSTTSSNFPLENPFQWSNAGSEDAFVTKLSASGNSLNYSTYLGGGADDGTYGGGLAVDNFGNAYVTGVTYSSNFPTLNPFQATFQGGVDAFVTKIAGLADVSGFTVQHLDFDTVANNATNIPLLKVNLTGFDTDTLVSVKLKSRIEKEYAINKITLWKNAATTPFKSYTISGRFDENIEATLAGFSVPFDGNDTLTIKVDAWTDSVDTDTTYQMSGLEIVIPPEGLIFKHGPAANTAMFTDNYIANLAIDATTGLWVGTPNYIVRFDLYGPADDVSDEITPLSLPEKAALDQNYPNPFNPITEIGFDLPKPLFVSLDIFDVLGRKVTTLINEQLAAGSKQVQWNGRNNTGAEVASGVYFYRLRTGDHVEVKKMVLLK